MTVSLIFILIYASLVLWFVIGWLHIRYKITGNSEDAVTLIIPCRNEEVNIVQVLGCINQQKFNFQNLEVLIVDDHSSDQTIKVIRNWELGIRNFKPLVIELEEGELGKKTAIKKAIEKAKGQIIVCTDADCMVGPGWLNSLCCQFLNPQTQMVCGPVMFFDQPGFWNRLLQLDFISLIGIGAATLSQGVPGMCNGANLAYRKSAFVDVNGFEGNFHLPSGDDEFLMHKIFNKFKNGVVFLKDEEAIVQTASPQSLPEFINQRLRWGSKTGFYQGYRSKLIPIFMFGFNVLMFSSPFMLFFGLSVENFIWLWLIKLSAELIFFSVVLPFFKNIKLLLWLVPAQLFHVSYVAWIGILSIILTYRWKGRRG